MFSDSPLHDTRHGDGGATTWPVAAAQEAQAQGYFDPLNVISCSNQYRYDGNPMKANITWQHQIIDEEKSMNISSVPIDIATQQRASIQQMMLSNMEITLANIRDVEASTGNSAVTAKSTFTWPTAADAAKSVPSSAARFLLGQQVNSSSVVLSLGADHHATKSRRTLIPNEFDVLCGKGKPIQAHMGNVLLHKLVDLHMEHYMSCHRESKRRLVDQVLVAMKAKDMRFLKRYNDHGDKGLMSSSWIEIDDEAAKEKISHCFRSRLPRAQK